jgi:[FeFe] hydrogenase (group B1/B3)
MRGLYTPVTQIRRQVFAEIARLAYEGGDYKRIEDIPYKIIPGEIARYRDNVFKERAIVGERLRLAMGLSLRDAGQPAPISKGIEESAISEKYYEPPLITVIPFACDACAEKSYIVSENCRGCMAHPCTAVCPVKAVSIVNGYSHIDAEKCIKCGRCKEACPYDAITKRERPCASVCGVDAIENDHLGRAKINPDKCVSCGMCMVNCPFGAIADKSQIFQLIRAMEEGKEVIAIVAPAFVGQFGPLATPDKIKEALQVLGFSNVYEVALGADMGAMAEAHHYVEKVPNELPFLLTSCCPSWSMLAKKYFPDVIGSISNELTPMVATARYVKERHPEAHVTFIGPCAAKKLEASRKSVRSDVDFVITFEEIMGMFVAKEIEFADLEETTSFNDATAAGRGYGVAGGVAGAIEACIHEYYPDKEVKIDRAEGLADCKKLLQMVKAGKRNGYLIEGMGCPGGCIAGAGTIIPINKANVALQNFKKASSKILPNKIEEV